MKLVIVYTGDVKANKPPAEFESWGIGSCVVICMYDEKTKNGGLAHVMLPGDSEDSDEDEALIRKTDRPSDYKEGRYSDSGIDALLEKMEALGSKKQNLKATLVGGAEMFEKIGVENVANIGKRNIESVKNKLKTEGITIIKEDLGGNKGRSVSFNLDDGKVYIK